MHPLVNIGVSAARAAGSIILRYLDQVDRVRVESKGLHDFVSEVDRAAEREIIQVIRRAYPDDAIVAEESGNDGDSEREWIIDPLDGTTNYLHRFPHFCTSIAFRERGELQHGVIYDPLKQELFCASRGGGVQLNNRRMRVSAVKRLDRALIGTGFPLEPGSRLDSYGHELTRVVAEVAGVRRAGAAALDLAYVAAGRLDGFWERGLHSWDVAAGILMIREAGGIVRSLNDRDPVESGALIAANPKLIEPLAELLDQPGPSATDSE